jgi:transcriptional regulator with PAS, ATPase and Fis domain
MPKYSNFAEERLAQATQAVLTRKNAKIAKIAPEFRVSRTTLHGRIKKTYELTSWYKSFKYAVKPY